MHKPLDLDLLKTLVAVADTGSFSLAAARVGRSQSAVSMQIARLESMLGRQLLIRGSRSVAPTFAGNDLLAYARRLLQISDEAWAKVTQQDEQGTVRLGIPEDYAGTFLPAILGRFGLDHPRVTIEVTCEPSISLADAIAENRIDLAIVTRFDNSPEDVLRPEPMVWVASPQHAAWKQEVLPVALFQTRAARANILEALTRADRAFRCTYSSASLAGMIAIVQSGLAVAGVARCSVPSSLQVVGDVEGLPPIPHLEIGILRSPKTQGTAATALEATIRQELGTTAL